MIESKEVLPSCCCILILCDFGEANRCPYTNIHMYTYKLTYHQTNGAEAPYGTIKLNQATVRELFAFYARILIVLRPPRPRKLYTPLKAK